MYFFFFPFIFEIQILTKLYILNKKITTMFFVIETV